MYLLDKVSERLAIGEVGIAGQPGPAPRAARVEVLYHFPAVSHVYVHYLCHKYSIAISLTSTKYLCHKHYKEK